ncbi:MAG: IS66 family transposase [Solirubrobacterales bacterium]|nr:IS66 family transposase [Solirubrobacterales bacterium]
MELRREDAKRIAREGGDSACELLLTLLDRVAEQDERIAKLERRLGQNSVNSSLPPSSDRGQGPKRAARKRSERKQGAQLGHEGASRKLVDDPDETLPVRPDECRKCGRELAEGRVVGRPARHQVIDLPESAVVTTEHQLLKVACPACGTHTRAELPTGVERGAFGPRLRATVVMLAAMLMSRRATALVLADMFGAKLSTGSVEKILKDASVSLQQPWEAIKRAVQAGDVAHADETSWRRAGQRMWLWAALSATAACFQIDQTRARSVARDLLGDFDGILISDRYGVYAMLDPARRQVCLAHLARNFIAHADRGGAAGRHGARIKGLLDAVMILDRDAREHDRQLAWHEGQLRPLHDDLMDALEAGERGRTPELATLCANVLDLWPALWNFTEHHDVDATNYAEVRVMPRLEAERCSRWAVWLVKLGIIRALRGRREACRAAGSGRVWCGVGRCGRALVA